MNIDVEIDKEVFFIVEIYEGNVSKISKADVIIHKVLDVIKNVFDIFCDVDNYKIRSLHIKGFHAEG